LKSSIQNEWTLCVAIPDTKTNTNPNTVAEGYSEDSVNEKIKTSRKIQGGLAVSESTGVKSLKQFVAQHLE
jgi:hypothetical protein